MANTEKDSKVTLEMTLDDYGNLLVMIGVAIGAASRDDRPVFYHWIDFVNRMNTGNPRFRPYEIPAEFQTHADPS